MEYQSLGVLDTERRLSDYLHHSITPSLQYSVNLNRIVIASMTNTNPASTPVLCDSPGFLLLAEKVAKKWTAN